MNHAAKAAEIPQPYKVDLLKWQKICRNKIIIGGKLH